jgi:hypothetical protein
MLVYCFIPLLSHLYSFRPIILLVVFVRLLTVKIGKSSIFCLLENSKINWPNNESQITNYSVS